jgi:hypothetical protein
MFTQPLRYSWMISALVLAVCSTQKEPAQKLISDTEALISDTEATVNAAAPAAARYIPDRLADARSSATSRRLSARITP